MRKGEYINKFILILIICSLLRIIDGGGIMMKTVLLSIKIRKSKRLANKYSQKSNKARGSLERNHYFQKYIFYYNKTHLLEESRNKEEII
jgi:hypothetical protein